MKTLNSYKIVLLVSSVVFFSACKKFLDEKPNISLEIPSSASDLQALLNNVTVLNAGNTCMPEIASDDYYLQYAPWTSLSTFDAMNYVWDSNTADNNTWATSYKSVLLANTVLDNLNSVSLENSSTSELSNIKGQALFFRAFTFYNLAQVYAKAYNAQTANTDLGICLKLTSSVTASSKRATVQETYGQIINDLKEAANLLPTIVQFSTTPSKQAAFALLARTYLATSDYENAESYSDQCLKLQNSLMDFNTLNASSSLPIPRFNPETIYEAYSGAGDADISSRRALIDTLLFQSYINNDLRRVIFFKYNSTLGGYNFTGSYVGMVSTSPFDGLATDEMYLIRSECEARLGDVKSALTDLNTLLKKRWLTGTYTDYTSSNVANPLSLILSERRKELVWRCTRWTDLKRLNQDPSFAVTIIRNLNGTLYTLPPNDLRYTFLIPGNVVTLGGIQQNPR
jgi:hypothetical protein